MQLRNELFRKGTINLLMVLMVGVSALQPVAAEDVITSIGIIDDLGTLGGTNSAAYAINDFDQIAGWSETLTGEHHAFLWRNKTMNDLGTLGGTSSEALGINNAGQIVGWAETARGERHAFVWQSGVMTNLGTLGGVESTARNINENGIIVGQSTTASGENHAFVWESGVMTDLGTLGGLDSLAADINEGNSIVGWAQDGSAIMRAVQWTFNPVAITDLGVGGDQSQAFAMNDAGQIVGSDVNSGVEEGFRRAPRGALTRFTLIGGQRVIQILDIDNRGFNTGMGLMNSDERHSTVWWDDASEARDQGTLGGTFSVARGMNDFAGMVGESTLALGETHAAFWRTDTDGDGVFDEVDTVLGAVSDFFSDARLGGITTGDIADRGDQRVIIIEEPVAGVRVLNGPTEEVAAARVQSCGAVSRFRIDARDNTVVTCTSSTFNVDTGPIEITLTGNGGTIAEVTVNSGNGFTFKPDVVTVIAPAANNETLVFTVNGCRQVSVAPGETKSLLPPPAMTLTATQDSFVRAGAANTNEGANPRLRIKHAGMNRALVGFDLSGVATACVKQATLKLDVQEASGLGTGRAVTVHRLLSSWTEGNGWNIDGDIRGTGPGVTWNCATDSNIFNQQPNCATQWGGGTFAAATAPPVLHTNGMVGQVSFDVTQDVLADAQYGWLVKKQSESQSGKVEYSSREDSVAPQLVLQFS